jgi:hypothetical protein
LMSCATRFAKRTSASRSGTAFVSAGIYALQ